MLGVCGQWGEEAVAEWGTGREMKEWWEGSGDAGGWYVQILSWEFCGRSHEELLPRRLIVPQVHCRCGVWRGLVGREVGCGMGEGEEGRVGGM